MLVFDIESDGLLDTISKIHCINALDRATGREYRFTDHEYYQDVSGNVTGVRCPRDGDIREGLAHLTLADTLAGHHIIGYDLPAIEKVYPQSLRAITGKHYDSKIASQLIYPDLKDKDWTRIRKGKLPEDFKKYVGSHSLFPWGIRLGGEAKSDFTPAQYGHTWKTMPFTQEMDEYCMQDVRANVALIEHFEKQGYDEQAIWLEMEVAKIITWQERHGIAFDYAAAEVLAKELYEKQYELEQKARAQFPPFEVKNGKPFVPKRDNAKLGYVKGVPVQKWKTVAFNPASNAHVAQCLTAKYGWEPVDLTPTGLPKIDEETLGGLPYPEAQVIAEYRTVQKRLSQLAEGAEAWMKKERGGRIYGRVNQLGTVTGRMAHFGPNLAQVPANHAPFGERCRSLFVADPGRVIVGCDADAIELRILAHYLARYDDGAYVRTVLDGRKEDGTDMHSRNRDAIGLTLRDTAKTWFYAFIYGAGNFKLGTIVLSEWPTDKLTKFYAAYPPGNSRRSKIAQIGKRSRDKLTSSIPAFGQLVGRVQACAKRGYLVGLDGRKIPVRAQHSALNSLCQSAGAVIMKQALVLMFAEFRRQKLDVIPLLNVHDEVQLSVNEEDADAVGTLAARAIKEAGESFQFRCPLGGDYKVGRSWAETH